MARGPAVDALGALPGAAALRVRLPPCRLLLPFHSETEGQGRGRCRRHDHGWVVERISLWLGHSSPQRHSPLSLFSSSVSRHHGRLTRALLVISPACAVITRERAGGVGCPYLVNIRAYLFQRSSFYWWICLRLPFHCSRERQSTDRKHNFNPRWCARAFFLITAAVVVASLSRCMCRYSSSRSRALQLVSRAPTYHCHPTASPSILYTSRFFGWMKTTHLITTSCFIRFKNRPSPCISAVGVTLHPSPEKRY